MKFKIYGSEFTIEELLHHIAKGRSEHFKQPIIDALIAAERERDELHERLSLVRDQRDAELNKNTQLEAELARRDASAGEPVYQFITNRPDIDGYIEWADCNKDYYTNESVDNRRVLYTTAPPAVLSQAIGEVRLGDFRDDGTRHAMVVCLHDQADWENFADGTKLYLRQ